MTGWVQPPPSTNPYTTYPWVGQAPAVSTYGPPTFNASLSSMASGCCTMPSAQQQAPQPAQQPLQQPMVCVPLNTWQALQGVQFPNNLSNSGAMPIASSVSTAPPVVSPLLATSGPSVRSYTPLVPQSQQQQSATQYNINQSTTNYTTLPASSTLQSAMPSYPLPIPTNNGYNTTPTGVSPAANPVVSPVLNPRGVAVPAGGDPFTHPIPEVLPPYMMAPWAYFNPSPMGQQLPQQPPALPSQALNNQPQAAPPVLEPPPAEAPAAAAPPAPPAAANPLQGLDAPKGASGANPNLPGMSDAFPLTRELVEKWKADLDDRHPVTSRRTQAANEIATFLLQHPETTLEGQPRQILERFVNNILSTGRTGSDTSSNTAVERDLILIALKQGGFYNVPATTVQHIDHLAKHSKALHGLEQTAAQEVLAKHLAGDFTPTQEFVTTYEGRFPWVITTREQAKEAPPKTKQDAPPEQVAQEALYQAPNPVSAALPITGGAPVTNPVTTQAKKPWYKRMFTKPPKEQTPQTVEANQLNPAAMQLPFQPLGQQTSQQTGQPAANNMGGQRLNLLST